MGLNDLKKERNIDIVFCIDATSSMGPCIDNVRKHASEFYRVFTDKMKKEYNSEIALLRVQVIVFRDLECDVDALQKSEFFELPTDTDMFEKYLKGITPRGGGDYKESGLEALFTAMKTDWEACERNDRQVIVLFTDADAIDFKEKRNRTGYPDFCNESTFLNTWSSNGNNCKLQDRCKRLIIFAPANTVYDKKIQPNLKRSQMSIVAPKNGMADIAFDDIYKMLCASASSN